jgi:hypothetical protein
MKIKFYDSNEFYIHFKLDNYFVYILKLLYYYSVKQILS